MTASPLHSIHADAAPGPVLFGLGWAGLALVYVLVFSLTGSSAIQAIGFALANVAPAALLAVPIVWAVHRILAGRPWLEATAWHLMLGAVFTGIWYGSLAPSRAMIDWIAGYGFTPELLTGAALPWQLFQGMMIYTVIAVAAHGVASAARSPHAPVPPSAPAMTRYLMRRGDEMRPVEVDAIISIQGADDYAEVTTAAGVHLARMTLQQFAETLPPGRFVRVHRSWIVNFDRLERAEPTGDGRLLLHLDDGRSLTTSRSGAALLRDRLV